MLHQKYVKKYKKNIYVKKYKSSSLEYVKEFASLQEGTGSFNRMSNVNECLLTEYFSVITKNPCVQVFSKRGKFLYSFGKNELKEPSGVCVSLMNIFM